MKTRLIIPVMLIVCFSCGTNNKPLSDAQKEQMIGEVKEVVKSIIAGAEEANIDMILGILHDSPDFVALFNGSSLTFPQFEELGKSVFSTLENQKGTIVNEKYVVLDNSTVLFTANSRWIMNYKDGRSVLQDPWAMQYVFKKIDNNWKIISFNESGSEQSVKNEETSNKLNQAELMKKFIGTWKSEAAKDTTIFQYLKPYGTGIEGEYKVISNGKAFNEGKQLWSYDSQTDKILLSVKYKEGSLRFYAYYFTSDTKFIIIPYSTISNPDSAPWRYEGEFKSPDIVMETYIVNNNPQETVIFNRVK